jgi:hypothetical protein
MKNTTCCRSLVCVYICKKIETLLQAACLQCNVAQKVVYVLQATACVLT